MSQLTIEFLKAQMTALQEGTATEEQVCQAIEAEVYNILKEEVNQSVSQKHFEDLYQHYARLADYDSIYGLDDEDNNKDNNEDTTNEY